MYFNRMRAAVVLVMLSVCVTGCAASVRKTEATGVIPFTPQNSQAIVLNVTGSKVATGSSDWEQLKGEWRGAMKRNAASIGSRFVPQEGDPKPTGEPGTLVVVDIADYRYLSPGARYAFGVMTGNAYLNLKVQFRDLATGNLLGERAYDTSSTAWQGAFSAMTEKQVDAVCREIVGEISRR